MFYTEIREISRHVGSSWNVTYIYLLRVRICISKLSQKQKHGALVSSQEAWSFALQIVEKYQSENKISTGGC